MTRRLLLSGAGVLGIGVASKLLAVVTAVLLARVLGPEGYGVYAFVLATVALLAIPVQLGLPSLATRLVALYEQDGAWQRLRGFMAWADGVVLLLAILVLLTGIILTAYFQLLPAAVPASSFWLGLCLLPLLGLMALRAATLRGLRHVVAAQFTENFVQPLALPLLLVTLLLVSGRSGLTAEIALQCMLVAATAALVTGSVLRRNSLPTAVIAATKQLEGGRWMREGLPFFLAFSGHVALRNTDIAMLGFLTTTEDTGIYRVASQAAMLVAFVVSIVHAIIGPYITRFHNAGATDRLQQIVAAGCWVGLAGSLPLFLVYLLAGPEVIAFFFGDEYLLGTSALLVLSTAHVVYSLMAPVGPLLGMTGFAWHATLAIAISAGINVILNLVLIPAFGIDGAAAATLASVLLMHLLMAYFAFRCTGIAVPKLWPLDFGALFATGQEQEGRPDAAD